MEVIQVLVAGALMGFLAGLGGSVGREVGLRQSEGWAVRAEPLMRGSVALVL